MKRGGFREGAGRPAGAQNRRTKEIEAFARSIVEDRTYQETVRQRALTGDLPPVLEQMLFYYAYGKPIERREVDVTQRVDVRVTTTLGQALSHAYRPSLTAAD